MAGSPTGASPNGNSKNLLKRSKSFGPGGGFELAESFYGQELITRRQMSFHAGEASETDFEQLSPVAKSIAAARAKLSRGNTRDVSPTSKGTFASDDLALLKAAHGEILTTTQILGEHLDTSRRGRFLKVVLRRLGLQWMVNRARYERERRSSPYFSHPYPLVDQMVKSVPFEMLIGIIMCVNAIVIGFQTSLSDGDQESQVVFDILENVFTTIFILEVICRLISSGWTWLLDPINFWDVTLIVLTGVLPMWILKPLGVDSGGIRLFSVVRVLRTIKLVRMVRMVPLFRVLYHLVVGLLGSLRLLLFTYVLMGIVLYILAVFSVYGVGKAEVLRDDPLAQDNFRSVPRAILSLLQVMSCDWTGFARPLMKKSWTIFAVCSAVIGVVTLVLLNLITAVICNAAVDRAKDDLEMVAREKREKRVKEIGKLTDLFHELDLDANGKLSKEEFQHATTANVRVRQMFQLLGVPLSEAEDIWDLIAIDGDEVEVEAFAETLQVLQAEVKAKDTFTLMRRIGRTNYRVRKAAEKLEALKEEADRIDAICVEMDREVGSTLYQLHEMVQSFGDCIPKDPAKRKREDVEGLCRRFKDQATLLW